MMVISFVRGALFFMGIFFVLRGIPWLAIRLFHLPTKESSDAAGYSDGQTHNWVYEGWFFLLCALIGITMIGWMLGHMP